MTGEYGAHPGGGSGVRRRWSRTSSRRPQAGQRIHRHGRPRAFHRRPPTSQIDDLAPQAVQSKSQSRDSASIEAATDPGSSRRKAFRSFMHAPYRHDGGRDRSTVGDDDGAAYRLPCRGRAWFDRPAIGVHSSLETVGARMSDDRSRTRPRGYQFERQFGRRGMAEVRVAGMNADDAGFWR